VPALAKAAAAAEAEGHPTRAVLLCHPNNPIGRGYTAKQLQEMLEWCIEKGVHLISDEVYANSIFGAGAQFTSLATLAERHMAAHPEAADRVKAFAHVVFGVSKDYCASGFRVGAVWTQNEALVKAAALAGYFGGVSNIVQHQMSDMFEDTDWLLGFISENSKRLGAAYAAIAGALKAAGIPFHEADSTMMIWVDLRRYLEAPTWEAEQRLWHRLADEQRVILTPGECCHGAEPGFFRCCYAWMDDIEAMRVTVQRIQKCIAQ
jgi:1-aminocyclopropane-1-carboxylate synthase